MATLSKTDYMKAGKDESGRVYGFIFDTSPRIAEHPTFCVTERGMNGRKPLGRIYTIAPIAKSVNRNKWCIENADGWLFDSMNEAAEALAELADRKGE